MHRVWAALAGVAPASGSALLALGYLATGNLVLLAGTGVGVAATVAGPVAVAERAHHAARTAVALRRRENRRRYDAHAARLNHDVFALLSHLTLVARSGAEPSAPPSGSAGIGIALAPGGAPVEGLPNWESAIRHLIVDPELAAAWRHATEATRAYATALDTTTEQIVDRVSAHVLEEYGFMTRLDGSRFRPSPWCDVGSLTSLLLDPGDAWATPEFARIEAAPEATPAASARYFVVSGERMVFGSRDDAEADPGRLARVVRTLAADRHVARLRAVAVDRERAATQAVAHFSELARRYSDRITLEGSFHGDCAACAGWRPR